MLEALRNSANDRIQHHSNRNRFCGSDLVHFRGKCRQRSKIRDITFVQKVRVDWICLLADGDDFHEKISPNTPLSRSIGGKAKRF